MQKAAYAGAPEGAPPDSVLRRLRISLIRRATLEHRGGTQEVFIIDLGLLGLFVEREQPLPVGEEVRISFVLPGNEIPVVARCRVAWCHERGAPLMSKSLPPGLGLEFAELSETDRRRLRELILEQYRRSPRARQFVRQWPTTSDEERKP